MSFEGPATTPLSDGARAHLARRIGLELRCGCPVVVADGAVRTLVASLDAATPDTLAAVLAAGGPCARLVVGAGRAASAFAAAAAMPPERAVALAMPAAGLDPARVLDAGRAIAGPVDMRAVVLGEAPSWAGPVLAAAKGEGLLPALALAGLRDADDAWAGSGLMVVAAADLRGLRPAPARLRLVFCGSASVPLRDCASARLLTFRSEGRGLEHLAVEVGRPAAADAPLVRIHSSCLTGDLLGSLRCDCGEQLRGAIARIAAEGCGLVLYLPQEGRGIGLVNKMRAYRLQDGGLDTLDANHALGWEGDARRWDAAAAMLDHRGVRRLRLLSNNPEKAAALAERGFDVAGCVRMPVTPNAFNARYVATKVDRCGHAPFCEA